MRGERALKAPPCRPRPSTIEANPSSCRRLTASPPFAEQAVAARRRGSHGRPGRRANLAPSPVQCRGQLSCSQRCSRERRPSRRPAAPLRRLRRQAVATSGAARSPQPCPGFVTAREPANADEVERAAPARREGRPPRAAEPRRSRLDATWPDAVRRRQHSRQAAAAQQSRRREQASNGSTAPDRPAPERHRPPHPAFFFGAAFPQISSPCRFLSPRLRISFEISASMKVRSTALIRRW